jgi:hypothetical protein
MRVDSHDSPKVLQRLKSVPTGDAPKEATEAFKVIDLLLRKDNTSGELSRRDPENLTSAVILNFPGYAEPPEERFGPLTEPFVVDGQLTRLGGGKDSTAHAQITYSNGKTLTAELSLELGKKLKNHLWGATLRFSGFGRWERTEEGVWELLSFKLADFLPLEEETLIEVTKKLRALEPTDWAQLPEIDQYIKNMRENNLH